MVLLMVFPTEFAKVLNDVFHKKSYCSRTLVQLKLVSCMSLDISKSSIGLLPLFPAYIVS